MASEADKTAPAVQDKAPEPAPTPTPEQAPNPMAAAAQNTVPIAPTAAPPPVAPNPIPAMNNRTINQLFNRMDRDASRQVHVVNIDVQDTLSGETYDQLQTISSVTLPITRARFIRMWKTLILKRIQDVFEQEFLIRPENYVRINRNVLVPATLADALHSLGSFFSAHTGRNHVLCQPDRPANPQTWWTVDAQLVRDWMATSEYMARAYIMKEYPSQRETTQRPIVLTHKMHINNLTQIKALTNEPRLVDGFIRLVNDDLFVPHERFTVNACALNMTMPLNEINIRGRYIAGYVTERNI